MITVDTREKHPWSEYWTDDLYTVATMSTGDYTNGDIIVERKSVPDICNSLGKGKKRFYRELQRGVTCKLEYLIIEGGKDEISIHLKKVGSRMSVNYIMHCLKEIHTDYNIQVIMANDREDAAAIALHLLTRDTQF